MSEVIEVTESITYKDLQPHIGLSAVMELVINSIKVKSVCKLLHEDTRETLGLCIYFSDDTSSPDIIVAVGSDDEADEVITDLVKSYKRNKIKVVKLNFKEKEV